MDKTENVYKEGVNRPILKMTRAANLDEINQISQANKQFSEKLKQQSSGAAQTKSQEAEAVPAPTAPTTATQS